MNQTPDQIPNRFPLPDNPAPRPPTRSSAFRVSDINWPGIIVVAVLIIVLLVGWVIIRDLSNLGGSFGSSVSSWLDGASIYPKDQSGFANFLRLVGIGAFIAVMLAVFKRK